MKIGLIADIHADPAKLLAVLEELDGVVDLILCGGDLTGYGSQPNEVIDIIRKRGIPTVKGNHDSPSADITEENAAYLRNLPLEWRDTLDGKHLYMCHGIPSIPFIGITRHHFPDEKLVRMLNEVAADILITAHTHQAMLVELPDGRMVINAGAVFLDNYAVLSLPDMTVTFF